MKNSIFNAVCKTRYLALLVVLIFTCGNAWGADVNMPTSGRQYRFKATYNSTSYYMVAPTSSGKPGVTTTEADGTVFTFTKEQNAWYITFKSGNTTYYMKESGSNAEVVISTSKNAVTTVTTNGSFTKIGGTKWIQFNYNNGTPRMGCYSSSQTGVMLSEVSSYSVVWTINPAAGGTLSATSGTSTTVTPNSAYTYGSPAYSVTSGTATVVQSTNTFTATPSANCTIRINMVEKPKYTITYNAGTGTCGTDSWTQPSYGASTTLPTATAPATCSGWSFAGWCTASAGSADDNTTSPGTILTSGSSYTPTSNITLYAVYTKSGGGGGGGATLTKMVTGNTLSDGDKIVVVASGDYNSVAMYQETTNTSYVQKWDCSTLNTTTVSADDKNWWTVTATEGGFYLGDATNGYLNMSSNNLYCDEDQSVWTLADLGDGTFRLQSNSRNLSYRHDLDNAYWRMGGTSYGTSGQTVLDIYKYSTGGGGGTTYYMTNYACSSCDKQVTITKGSPAGGGSFDLDKTGAQDCCDALVVTVSNIVAPSGKQFSAITQSGIASGVTIDQNAKTVTYAANSNGSSTINVTFEDLPKYTVTLKDDNTTITQASYDAAVTLPSRTGCDGYTFAGWTKTWTAPQESWTTTAPTIIPAGSYTPTADENLYPVYTKAEGGGGSATLTKLGSTYEPTAGDNLVIVEPNGSYALYQETSGTYVAYWNFSNSAATVGADDKNYVTLESDEDDGWYLGDATNGYVYNGSSNNLIVDTDNHTSFSITWNSTGFNIVGNSRWLSCRTDVQTPNTNKYRMGGATSGSASGNALFDLYKYVAGGGSTTYYISVPDCCTDWSTPTVSYSSSLAIGGTANVTIGSGTTHGAISYESSNEDILTVESDGTITAVGAGTAHIIATWAGDATYCGKSANSNDITVSGIEITGTLPVNFGQVYQNAVIGDKTLSVTGLGLTNDITPSLPAGSPFSFSPASLAQDCSGATLTISASTATIGEYSHTLTLTSGTFTATATINMNVVAMPSCTFVDNLHNLSVDKNGVSLSNYDLTAAAGTSVVFPVLANQEKGVSTCEEQHYVFVGWTTSDDNDHPENHLVTSHNLENGDDITYYAVWADGVAGVSYTKLTSSTFKTSPTKYVIGADDGEGTDLFFYSCEKTDQNNSWGYVSSDPSTDAPIQFTLSGSASELVVASTEATTRYLKAASGKQFFGMSSSSTTVVLGSGGTIESTADTYNNLRYNSQGGLRWYTGTSTGTAAYFYEVVAGSTPSYRTSCCADKVEAPTVTVTKTSTSITLTWGDETGATGWEVSWNGGAFGSPSGTRTHTVTGLTPNTSYTWQVRATYTDPKCGADIASGSTTTDQVYHVSYAPGDESANCNATGSTTDATAYEAGATVMLQANAFTLHGYDFNVWTTDDPDVTISSNQFTMPDHDVVITASWTAKVDKYFDRMHDQTDALHGGVEETTGINEGKYYIPKEGCNYTIPTASDSKTGDACQTSHYKLRGWIAASYMKGYPNNMTGEIGTGNESHIFEPTGTKTATGATYYAIWAEVVE